MTCSPHNNPSNYVETTVGKRIRVTCKRCGKFIGYRPPPDRKQTTKKRAKE